MLESNLGSFLTDLASNREMCAAFLKDPGAAMNRARLNLEEQKVVGKNDFSIIVQYLEAAGPRPATPERQLGDG